MIVVSEGPLHRKSLAFDSKVTPLGRKESGIGPEGGEIQEGKEVILAGNDGKPCKEEKVLKNQFLFSGLSGKSE